MIICIYDYTCIVEVYYIPYMYMHMHIIDTAIACPYVGSLWPSNLGDIAISGIPLLYLFMHNYKSEIVNSY